MNAVPKLSLLLSHLTLNDDRLVTLTIKAAEELLNSQPALGGLLRKVWKEGSFKEIRQLKILWP